MEYIITLSNGINMSWTIIENLYEVTFYATTAGEVGPFEVPLLTPEKGTVLISDLQKDADGFFTQFISGKLGPRGDYPITQLQVINGAPGITYIQY